MLSLLSPRLSQLRVRHLELLDIIAQSGSLRQVAGVLHVTQPAITAMLQEMESLLGVHLVDRDRQGARLTAEGIVIQQRLRLVLNALHGVQASLEHSPLRSHIRVGVLALTMLDRVPEAVALLRRQGLGITFDFVDGTVAEGIAGVLSGDLDCALGRLDTDFELIRQSKLSTLEIQKVPLQAVCGPDNPLGRKRRVHLKDLQAQPWILLPHGSRSRAAFDQAFSQCGLVPPSPTVESLSFFANFHLAAKTDLLTIATATAVERYAGLGLVNPLPIRWPIDLSPLMFFCRPQALEVEAVRRFRQAIADGIPPRGGPPKTARARLMENHASGPPAAFPPTHGRPT